MSQNGAFQRSDFRRVSMITETVPEFVRQEYRDETTSVVKELSMLLPQFKINVDAHLHAFSRSEAMRLTVHTCDDTLEIYALETLRQHLEEHRKMFTSVLTDSAEALWKRSASSCAASNPVTLRRM